MQKTDYSFKEIRMQFTKRWVDSIDAYISTIFGINIWWTESVIVTEDEKK